MASFIQLLVSGLATGGDLRPDRRRLHAAVADVADDQFRPGRIRHAAGVLHAGGDVSRRAVLARHPDRHRAVDLLLLGLVFKLVIVDPMLKHGVLPLVISTIALSLFMKEMVKDFYSVERAAVSVAGAADRPAFFRRGDLDAKPGRAGGRDRRRRGAASAAATRRGSAARCRRRRKTRRWRASSASRCGGWCSTPS